MADWVSGTLGVGMVFGLNRCNRIARIVSPPAGPDRVNSPRTKLTRSPSEGEDVYVSPSLTLRVAE